MEREITLTDESFLVSETNAKGIIIFANEEFCNVAGYTLDELLGQPHNLVRHIDMPSSAFKDLWDTVKTDEVWQGHVKNKTKQGGFYWVKATVYPYKNDKNEQCYMSIRRKPTTKDIKKYSELYKTMK